MLIRLFGAAAAIFKVWMLVDAFRKRRELWWYWVILMPFGDWFYFFYFKLQDRDMRWVKDVFRRPVEPPALDDLRARLDDSPSFANTVALARALYGQEVFMESAETFERALKMDRTGNEALFGAGLARAALGEHDAAVVHLRSLVTAAPSFSAWSGWPVLASSLRAAGRMDEAIAALDELVARSPLIPHRLLAARYLVEAGRKDEARGHLSRALEVHAMAPPGRQDEERETVSEVRRLLAELG